MKNLIHKITIAGLLFVIAISTPSCTKSFLDIQPKGKVIASSTSDYDHLLNNSNFPITSADGQVPMGDDAIVADPYFSGATLREQRLFRWDATIYEPDETPNEVSPYMLQLYILNKVINEVLQSENGTDAQKTALYEEAKAQRAYNNFMLVNYYGKPYNAATAATDPGFILVTSADVTQTNFTRATVQATYDNIVSDLKEAIPLMPVSQTTRVRMCKGGAEALLAKVYMFMGKYSDALPLLKAAFTDVPASFGNTTTLYDYNVTMVPGGTWGYNPTSSPTSFILSSPVGSANTEGVYMRYFGNSWNTTSSNILLDPATEALFGPNDRRRNFFSKQPNGGGTLPAGLSRVNGTSTTYTGVNLPDMYLLLAECQARTNDLNGAVASLLTLRQKRMPAADAAQITYTDQNSLIKFVIDERRREFVLKGYRWFDMRRLSTDPLFSATQYKHTYISATGGNITYTLTPERLTWRIPTKILNQNPGMVDNP